LDDGGRLAVARWDGTDWEKVGGGAFSGSSATDFDMLLYDGRPYVAASENISFSERELRVHAYVEDAGGGVPGWIEIWHEDGIHSGAVQLRLFGDTLYLAYTDDASLYDIRIYSLDLASETAAWEELP